MFDKRRLIVAFAYIGITVFLGCSEKSDVLQVLTREERLWLKENYGTVRIAPDPNAPPIEYFDSKGNFRGISADYIRLLEQKLDFKFKIVRIESWEEIIRKIKNREVDVLSAAVRTPRREDFLLFTDPYLSLPWVVITRKDTTGTLTLNDLKNKSVSAVAGYAIHDYLKKNWAGSVNIMTFESVTECLKQVSFGGCDATIVQLATASHEIEKEGITNLRSAGKAGPTFDCNMASRKDWPVLNSILKKGLAGIDENEKKEIWRKWIPFGSPYYLSPEFRRLVFILLGSSLFLLLVFFLWTNMLKKKVRIKTKKLIDSEFRFKEIMDRAPAVIYVKDIDGVYTFINRHFENLSGFSYKKVLGKTDFDLFPEEVAKNSTSNDRLVIETGKPIETEEFGPVNGDMHWFFSVKFPIYDRSGKINEICGISTDITELKKTEEKLRKVEEDLRHTIAISPGIIAKFNTKTGCFIKCNPALTKILGFSEEEFLSKPLADLVHPDNRRRTLDEMDKLAGGSVADFENRHLCKDGSYKWLRWQATGADEDGTVYAIATDFTEQKRAEEQIKKSLEEKVVLLREIYHRTKNNMQVISSMLDIQFADVGDADVLRMIKETESKIHSMALVHQKLYQSKNLSSIDLKEYVSDLAKLMMDSYNVQSEKVEFSLDLDETSVLIDIAIPCGLILNELISNSLKHAFPGDRKGRIDIRLKRLGNAEILIRVSDNGIGLPEGCDVRKTNTLGIETVIGLAEHQLQGKITFESSGGLSSQIRFNPENLYTERV